MKFGFADFVAAAFDANSGVGQIHPGQVYALRLVDQLVAAPKNITPQCKEHR